MVNIMTIIPITDVTEVMICVGLWFRDMLIVSTSFVNLLDNVMVGQTTKEMMAGVSLANQLIFIYNIMIFGGISGASIFGAQFFGAKDYESVRAATRFKLYISFGIFALAALVFSLFGEPLLNIFIAEGEEATSVAETIAAGNGYLTIMLAGLLPFAISQAYTSTLREAGETVLPMIAAIAAVLTNLVFNYLLIFGKFGFPQMGARGAALATVISRLVELTIIVVGAHKNKEKYFYLVGLYRTLRVPARMVKRIVLRGLPLLANETVWSFGMTTLTQCYSMRGLNVVAGMNISGTVSNLFNTVIFAMGNAVAIMVGQALGADEVQRAKETAWRLISFSVLASVALAAVLALVSPLIPLAYNMERDVRALAADFMRILAMTMPIMAFAHCCYFTLRSGGKTLMTFVFDSLSIWIVSVPVVYLLIYQTDLSIQWVYAIAQLTNLFKCVLGFALVLKGVWIHNIAVEATGKRAPGGADAETLA
jgi:putative MATE family efflux protein